MGCPCEKGSANPQAGEVGFSSDKVFMAPGESVDCFMKRAPDGDDLAGSGEEVLDKIANTAIPVKCDLSIDVQFKLTTNSLNQDEKNPDPDPNVPNPIDPNWKGPEKWSIVIKDVDGNEVQLNDLGLSFTEDGKLSGTLK